MSRLEISRARISAYTVPTEKPESDGTLRWDSTTLVLVELEAAGLWGIGYTYAYEAAGKLAQMLVDELVLGRDAFDLPGIWGDLVRAIRNLGRNGFCAMAVSAIDNALWDLKAKLLGLPLAHLLGSARQRVPVYGSGGFTSYTIPQLQKQLAGWVEEGIPRVKMKVGRCPQSDEARVRSAREAIGPDAELFVDANEAYGQREALRLALRFAELGVSWFEQPVHAEDLAGMGFIREKLPVGMDLATGEYLSDGSRFREVLTASAADVLQPDATRCLGVTGFLQAAALCAAFHIPVSSHCAPSLHLPLGCAVPNFRHLEYFYDHVRIEGMLFDGPLKLQDGSLEPDWERPGFGLELKRKEMERFAA